MSIKCPECDEVPVRYDSELCDPCFQAHRRVCEMEATPGMDARHRIMKDYMRSAIILERRYYRVRSMLDVHYRRAVDFREKVSEMEKEKLW